MKSPRTSQVARDHRAVWRLAADRVVVRRVGDHGPDAAAEVTGSAILVWLALEEPRTTAELLDELSDYADPAAELENALTLLHEHEWIERRVS